MEQNLYDLMDWAGIEDLVYSEASNPHAMLGPHLTESGLLIQALIPTAAQIVVKIASTGRKYAMELADLQQAYIIPSMTRWVRIQ